MSHVGLILKGVWMFVIWYISYHMSVIYVFMKSLPEMSQTERRASTGAKSKLDRQTAATFLSIRSYQGCQKFVRERGLKSCCGITHAER